MKNLLLSLTTAALVACGGGQSHKEEVKQPMPEPEPEVIYQDACFVLNFERISLGSDPEWIERHYGGIELRFYADNIVQSEYEIDYTHKKAAYKLRYEKGSDVYADLYVGGEFKLNYTKINVYEDTKLIYNLMDKSTSGVSDDYIGSETIRNFDVECVSTEKFENITNGL